MFRIGLTGSIGMGKSATAAHFRDLGVPVHDSDVAVHELYKGDAVAPLQALFPQAITSGVVDRARLAEIVLVDPKALKQVEEVVHPLVVAHRDAFVRSQAARGVSTVVFDIPLLLETGAADCVDLVLVVTCPPSVQKARVLARPGMTEARFDAILARQMRDAEKRRLAHAVIDTGRGHAAARRQIAELLRAVAGRSGRDRSGRA